MTASHVCPWLSVSPSHKNLLNHRFQGHIWYLATASFRSCVYGMDTVIDLSKKVFDLITSNPLLVVLVAAGLIPVGVRIFCSLRRAARG